MDEFLYMVPAGVGVARLAEMLFVAREVQDAVQQVGDGGVALGVQLVHDVDDTAHAVADLARPGDLLLMLGAGDIVETTPAGLLSAR